MIKKIFLSFLLTSTIATINAQEWHTDFKLAKEIASKEHKNLILVFQGSDWCGPCIKLDKEIWSQEEFKAYAKNNFVMVKVDFPKRKINKLTAKQQEKNYQLSEIYNKQGFLPRVIILNENGKVLGETGYKKMTPKKYIKLLASF
ncbi:MAG: thioredoxin fold domain-containing protein [Lutibacter sp.]|uniref:thioredoxin family protein n=1 Tax=Lutibacter sp. TaxID=1925666 RepID=UPI0019E5989A|nr:thioredoxin family protein [Lutibacter sp.]NOR28221.1 thioredoxin fold domain-containing protein [Lutibacter sp.]